MGLGTELMKVIIKVKDVVTLARRFEEAPKQTMREVVDQVHSAFHATLEQIMDAEIGIFLGNAGEAANKRNGYVTRTFAVKGIGAVRVRVPRDRDGRFLSKVVPPRRRYDEALEKDLAVLNLAGLSTRMLSLLSKNLLGIHVSAQEVSNALHTIVPAAKEFLRRPLDDRKFKYLYIDGTNFRVRRTTVEREPTLVVVGVDETDRKSLISATQGDKESRSAWAMVLADLKERGLDAAAVQLVIMDGLPGLAQAAEEAFPRARAGRCWVHKARNTFPRVPKRYQAEFKTHWDAMQYAESKAAARAAYEALVSRWGNVCGDAVACIQRDLEALLVHYDFPKEHWEALRTTNPIERVNKEFKRRSKSMETVSPDGLQALLAFTALRMEYGWATTPITSSKLKNLPSGWHRKKNQTIEATTARLLN
jgi:putative transposase